MSHEGLTAIGMPRMVAMRMEPFIWSFSFS